MTNIIDFSEKLKEKKIKVEIQNDFLTTVERMHGELIDLANQLPTFLSKLLPVLHQACSVNISPGILAWMSYNLSTFDPNHVPVTDDQKEKAKVHYSQVRICNDVLLELTDIIVDEDEDFCFLTIGYGEVDVSDDRPVAIDMKIAQCQVLDYCHLWEEQPADCLFFVLELIQLLYNMDFHAEAIEWTQDKGVITPMQMKLVSNYRIENDTKVIIIPLTFDFNVINDINKHVIK